MMFTKRENGNNNGVGNSNNGELLRDIEAISKALYLNKTPPKALISPANVRSKSAGKTRFSESKSNPKPRILSKNVLHEDKKSSSTWDWKKPLKALAHIRHHRFHICFFLHVHSIEGLPSNFNGINLCVHWKRKDEVLRTRPSRVLEGIAEFEEILMHKCCVYANRNGPHNSAKYEVKLFLIYASIVEASGLDTGKHLVDLTRLLPLTLEELDGEKSSGKWTTSFKLAGMATGATLNVSFGFSVMRDNIGETSSQMSVSKLMNFTENGSNTVEQCAGFGPNSSNGMLQQVGSVPSNLNHKSPLSSPSVDVKFCHELLPNLNLELSKSINFLYQKLSEGNMRSSADLDILSVHVEPLKPEPDPNFEAAKEVCENECDNFEFIVIEKGIEMSTREQLKLEQVAFQTVDGSEIETINVDDIIKDDDVTMDEETSCSLEDDRIDKVVVDDCKHEESTVCTKGSTMEELESAFDNLLISELAELEHTLAMDDFLGQEKYMGAKSNYKTSKMSKESLSLDDITESVANDFLNMIEHDPSDVGCDSYPESPRERLLREFEQEAIAAGNFILDFDTSEEQTEFASTSLIGSGCGDLYDDFDFSSVIQAAEEENKGASQLLINRRKVKVLEDLETEDLMREWGLNEKAFQSSPCNQSNGFGSPIELPPEVPDELPPVGDGFGPFVRTNGGGCLRSMSPSLFKSSTNVRSLIIQISSPIVLPAEMGSDIMEILQQLASVGIEKLCMQANTLMPLEDITGKTMQQVAKEAAPRTVVPKRQALLQLQLLFGGDSLAGRKEFEGFQSGWSCDNLNSGLTGELGSGYVVLQDLAPSAMDKIEALSIEGLRIQSSMSSEEAPSSISPLYNGETSAFEEKSANFGGFLSLEGAVGFQLPDVRGSGNSVDGLMGLSITLDEWLRLDAGIISDEDQNSERMVKILSAHHAKCIDLVNGTLTSDINWGNASGRKHGLLGNKLTVGLMVLLRDPLRNYEPVGASMLALIQVERAFVNVKPKMYYTVVDISNEDFKPIEKEDVSDKRKEEEKNEEDTPWFKIMDIHLAGLNTEPGKNHLWGTKTQRQSGTRWLLASGMGKCNKHPFSKSKAILRSYPKVTTKVHTDDVLWSITSDVNDRGANWKELAALITHVRNPNIILRDESIRSQGACNF